MPARPSRSPRDDDLLTHLIGRIYDAALEPTLWTGVLAQIGEFVGGIVAKDAASKDGTPHYHFGVDRSCTPSAVDTHMLVKT
jgi:hypothetical protein